MFPRVLLALAALVFEAVATAQEPWTAPTNFVCGVKEDSLPSFLHNSKATPKATRIGARSVLVVRVDFPNAPGAIISESSASNEMASVNGFFKEVSFQQFSLPTVAVTPVLRMPRASGNYGPFNDIGGLARDAYIAAQAAGIPISTYDFLIYSFPVAGFPFTAVASIGGNEMWVQGDNFRAFILNHELGHNLGLSHARAWYTPDDSIIGAGVSVDYGNIFDTMGTSPFGNSAEFNVNYRYALGWLRDSDIHLAVDSGLYRVFAMDAGLPLDNSKRLGLRVPAKVNFNGVTNDYWIDVRQALAYPITLNGVLIKAAPPALDYSGNLLLDTTPGSTRGVLDAPLIVGRTFTDAARGIFITPVKAGNKDGHNYVDVQVNIGGTNNHDPSVIVSATNLIAAAFAPITFTADASDPDGDSLAYSWDFGDFSDDRLSDKLNQASVMRSWFRPGDFVVRCTVSDLKGGLGSHSIVVHIGSPATFTISGRVLEGSIPLQGVRVLNGPVRPDYRYTFTDSDGFYMLTDLPPGTNVITAIKAGFSFSSRTVIVGPSATNIDVAGLPASVPFIAAVNPSHGLLRDSVALSGANFSGATSVRFGRAEAGFTIVSPTEISTTVPAGTSTGKIFVTTPKGTAASSDPFVLDAEETLAILDQPHAAFVSEGLNWNFSIKLSGSGPFGFQWHKDGTNIPGAVSSTLSITNASFQSEGNYSVTVTNPLGSIDSTAARLTLLTLPRAAGQPDLPWSTAPDAPWLGQTNVWLNNGADASSGSTNQSASDGGTGSGFSAQSSSKTNDSWIETIMSGPALVSFWWQLSARFPDDSLDFSVDGTNRARIVGTKNWTQVSTVLEDETHVVRWTRRSRGSGSLAWLTHVRNDGAWFTTSPQSATVLAGDAATLSASSGSPAAYQWQRNDSFLARATNATLNFPTAVPDDAGDYRVIITSASAMATSTVARLDVLPLLISKAPADQDVAATSNASFSVQFVSRAPANFQWLFQNQPLPNATSQTLSFRAMPTNAGTYQVVVANTYGAVTSAPAALIVRSKGPQLLGGISNYLAFVGENVSLSVPVSATPLPTYRWTHNRRLVRGAINASLTIPKIQRTQKGDYALAAQNLFGAVTQHIQVVVQPMVIEQQPTNQNVLVGNPLSLRVIVGSSLPVKYQWRFNGVAVPRATNATLLIPSAQLTNAGNYDVVIRRGRLSLTSSNAQITINGHAPAFIVEPQSREFRINDFLVFESLATGNPAPTYQWYFNDAPLSGAQQPTLTMRWTNETGGAVFAIASNQFGTATSGVAQLIVRYGVPTPRVSPNDFSTVVSNFVLLRTREKASPPIISYQWSFNGTNIADATNSILVLPSITAEQAGRYRVSVSNAVGIGTSPPSDIEVQPALALDQWQWSIPLPRSEDLLSAIFGNGVFVAVGESGTILTSSDAQNWRDQSLLTRTNIPAIAFASGRFMMLMPGDDDPPALLISSNATDWAATGLPPGETILSLCAANNRFITAGSDAQSNLLISVSDDGSSWTQSTLPIAATNLAVAYGNGRFVALAGSQILISTNAARWSAASALPDALNLSFGNTRFVAVGNAGKVWTSSDGSAWLPRFSGTNQDLLVAGFAANRFIAAGKNGTIVTSSDGVTWTSVPSTTSSRLNAFAPNAQGAALFGKGGVILSSSNGLAWSERATGPTVAGLNGIVFTNDAFIAVGDSGTILASIDGRDWTARVSPTSKDLFSITRGPTEFIAVGEDGRIIGSPDALTWTVRVSATSNSLRRIAWLNNLYLAVGDAGASVVSTNGIDWTSHAVSLPGFGATLEGVAHGNGLFIAVGGYDDDQLFAHCVIVTSPDAVVWTVQTPDFHKKLRNIQFVDNQFVAIGNDGLVVTSEDGFLWRQQLIAEPFENLRALQALPGLLVSVGNDGIIFSSTNGLAWKRDRLFTAKNLHDLAYGKNMLVAAASDGTILRAEGVLPSLAVTPLPDRNVMKFSSKNGAHEYYRLQISDDHKSWRDLRVLTNGVGSQSIIETNLLSSPHSFFRLQFP